MNNVALPKHDDKQPEVTLAKLCEFRANLPYGSPVRAFWTNIVVREFQPALQQLIASLPDFSARLWINRFRRTGTTNVRVYVHGHPGCGKKAAVIFDNFTITPQFEQISEEVQERISASWDQICSRQLSLPEMRGA